MMRSFFAVAFATLTSCCALAADDGFANAAWKAFELGGKAIDGPTLDYAADKVSGHGGCNRFFGPIALSEPDGVKFGLLATTRRMCEGKMELERDYLAALQAARTFALENGVLILKGDGGAVLAKFRK